MNDSIGMSMVQGHTMDVRVFTGVVEGRKGTHITMVSLSNPYLDPDGVKEYRKHCCHNEDGWMILFSGTDPDNDEPYAFWDGIEQGEGGEWLELQMTAIKAIAECVTRF